MHISVNVELFLVYLDANYFSQQGWDKMIKYELMAYHVDNLQPKLKFFFQTNACNVWTLKGTILTLFFFHRRVTKQYIWKSENMVSCFHQKLSNHTHTHTDIIIPHIRFTDERKRGNQLIQLILGVAWNLFQKNKASVTRLILWTPPGETKHFVAAHWNTNKR